MHYLFILLSVLATACSGTVVPIITTDASSPIDTTPIDTIIPIDVPYSPDIPNSTDTVYFTDTVDVVDPYDVNTVIDVPIDHGPPPSELCIRFATVKCEKLNVCSNGVNVSRTFGTMSNCIERTALRCARVQNATGSSITDANLTSCIEAIPDASCSSVVWNTLSPCIFRGTLTDWQDCTFAEQCASGQCNSACSVCYPTRNNVGEGESCSPAAARLCMAPMQCIGPFGKAAMGICYYPQTVLGAPCDPQRITAPSCETSLGLYCDPTTNTCAQQYVFAPDEVCSISAIPQPALLCPTGGYCGVNRICVDAIADGNECDASGPDSQCQWPAECLQDPTIPFSRGHCLFPDPSLCH